MMVSGISQICDWDCLLPENLGKTNFHDQNEVNTTTTKTKIFNDGNNIWQMNPLGHLPLYDESGENFEEIVNNEIQMEFEFVSEKDITKNLAIINMMSTIQDNYLPPPTTTTPLESILNFHLTKENSYNKPLQSPSSPSSPLPQETPDISNFDMIIPELEFPGEFWTLYDDDVEIEEFNFFNQTSQSINSNKDGDFNSFNQYLESPNYNGSNHDFSLFQNGTELIEIDSTTATMLTPNTFFPTYNELESSSKYEPTDRLSLENSIHLPDLINEQYDFTLFNPEIDDSIAPDESNSVFPDMDEITCSNIFVISYCLL
ncbi:hypothetical protein G9A89_011514 [Geosiphon pyriformis]|nr:hypothetical protein G9A89_011514 [Geosiphon pyriformis]